MFNPIKVIKTKRAAKAEIRKLEAEIERIEKRIDVLGEFFIDSDDVHVACAIMTRQAELLMRIDAIKERIAEIEKTGCIETKIVA